MIGQEHMDRVRKEREADPFFRFFKEVQRPDGQVVYDRRIEITPGQSLQQAQQNLKPITQEAADIYKEKTGKAYTGVVLKKPESKTESETLGKTESELSRRERLKRRKDASFQYAAMQKQGGVAQRG